MYQSSISPSSTHQCLYRLSFSIVTVTFQVYWYYVRSSVNRFENMSLEKNLELLQQILIFIVLLIEVF